MNGEQLKTPTTDSPLPPAVAQQAPFTQPVADSSNEPIDAVVTWVDGNDPAHFAKRQETLRKLGKAARHTLPAGTAALRFSDNGELFWCLHSIRKFAPWIRYIHLVTDNQVPAFLTPDKQAQLGVRIVDHTEIFRGYEWALPTFNSNAIEAMIWRIEGLAERFVYFNDDVLLLKPIASGAFFRQDLTIIRGHWGRIRGATKLHHHIHRIYNWLLRVFCSRHRTMQLHMQMNGARLAGYRWRYLRTPHVPHPLNQVSYFSAFHSNPAAIKALLAHPFRTHQDFFPIAWMNHILIQNHQAVLQPLRDTAMLSAERNPDSFINHLQRLIHQPNAPFATLQSVESLSSQARRQLDELLERLLRQADQ